ncbi:Hypothetical predicted protein [Podarcis lilfordi]|uniref:Uncharacterized protein n=1 Tax=Podarcis lilfordi TaxID=74358 RepID=A0AA35PR11_9SAUR|nr:Hypothetical predicted protein [Podarcis lilfordi]
MGADARGGDSPIPLSCIHRRFKGNARPEEAGRMQIWRKKAPPLQQIALIPLPTPPLPPTSWTLRDGDTLRPQGKSRELERGNFKGGGVGKERDRGSDQLRKTALQVGTFFDTRTGCDPHALCHVERRVNEETQRARAGLDFAGIHAYLPQLGAHRMFYATVPKGPMAKAEEEMLIDMELENLERQK